MSLSFVVSWLTFLIFGFSGCGLVFAYDFLVKMFSPPHGAPEWSSHPSLHFAASMLGLHHIFVGLIALLHSRSALLRRFPALPHSLLSLSVLLWLFFHPSSPSPPTLPFAGFLGIIGLIFIVPPPQKPRTRALLLLVVLTASLALFFTSNPMLLVPSSFHLLQSPLPIPTSPETSLLTTLQWRYIAAALVVLCFSPTLIPIHATMAIGFALSAWNAWDVLHFVNSTSQPHMLPSSAQAMLGQMIFGLVINLAAVLIRRKQPNK